MPRYWIFAVCKKRDFELNEPSIQCSNKSYKKLTHKLCANVILADYKHRDFTCCKCLSKAKVRANNKATNISTSTTPRLNSQSQVFQTVYTWSYLPLASLGRGGCPLLYNLLLMCHC